MSSRSAVLLAFVAALALACGVPRGPAPRVLATEKYVEPAEGRGLVFEIEVASREDFGKRWTVAVSMKGAPMSAAEVVTAPDATVRTVAVRKADGATLDLERDFRTGEIRGARVDASGNREAVRIDAAPSAVIAANPGAVAYLLTRELRLREGEARTLPFVVVDLGSLAIDTGDYRVERRADRDHRIVHHVSGGRFDFTLETDHRGLLLAMRAADVTLEIVPELGQRAK